MKNLTTYSLFLLLLTLCFSCVKEADIITQNDPEVIPQEGETRLLTGLVKDESGNILPHASVKIILNDLELESEADENGKWNLIVPVSITEGFIVANKIDYSKSIQRITNIDDNPVEDIYLAKEQSNTELDLGFDPGNLKTLIGRIVDENANPIPDVMLLLINLLDDPQNENGISGIDHSLADGTFEIIYEDNNIISSTLHTLFSNKCGDSYSYTVQGQDPIEDLGDLELDYDSYSIFQTNLVSDGSSCYDNVSALAYYYDLEAAFQPVSYDQPLGDISVEYCPKENGAFYVGVESEDNTHFNGAFVPDVELADVYMFDICTPNPGNFLEISINGNVMTYVDNIFFESPRTVISQDSATPLSFRILNWLTSSDIGASHPRYQIGEIRSLSMNGTNEIEFNNIDDDRPFNYVNIVQDDDLFYAGIARAKLLATDGSEKDISIRFRVSK